MSAVTIARKCFQTYNLICAVKMSGFCGKFPFHFTFYIQHICAKHSENVSKAFSAFENILFECQSSLCRKCFSSIDRRAKSEVTNKTKDDFLNVWNLECLLFPCYDYYERTFSLRLMYVKFQKHTEYGIRNTTEFQNMSNVCFVDKYLFKSVVS